MVGVCGQACQARAPTSSTALQSSAAFLPTALSQIQPLKTQTAVSTRKLLLQKLAIHLKLMTALIKTVKKTGY